jgi:phospholipase/carboxylesterase
VFQAHGTQDPVVPLAFGQRSRVALESLGVPVEWHQYPMAHSVHPDEVGDLRSWLTKRFATL